MITYEEAKQTAGRYLKDICHCTEYTNAWAFANENSRMSIGGEDMPVIILKDTGCVVDSTAYYDTMSGSIVREFSC